MHDFALFSQDYSPNFNMLESWMLWVCLLLSLCSTTPVSAEGEGDEMIACPRVSSINYSTILEIDDVSTARAWNEVSGLAVSPTQLAPSGAPIMWGHNDGRDQGNFGTNFAAWDPITGERLMTFMMTFDDNSTPPIVNQDWEDMTIGTCGKTGSREICIYLADIGDNGAIEDLNTSIRPVGRPYRLYKIKEPILADYTTNSLKSVNYSTEMVTALDIDYLHPSSPVKTANAEGAFLDHTGWGPDGEIGDIYIVTKTRDFGRLYKVPASAWPTEEEKLAQHSPSVVGTDYVNGEFPQFLWTSAEMSWDGTKIIMGTIHKNYVFLRCPGQSVAQAIVGQDACMIWDNPKEASDNKKQFEATAWYPDDATVLNIAESMTTAPHIVKVFLDYSDPTHYCPTVDYTTNVGDSIICQTVLSQYFLNQYSSDAFIPEPKPDSWCDDAMVYFGSAAPSSIPSSNPSTPFPTASPSTAKPSVDFFAEDTSADLDPDLDFDLGTPSASMPNSARLLTVSLLLLLL
jgi:hypothetical protein